MVNWKNSNHLMESDDSVLGLETGTVVKSARGLGFNSNHDDPHVVPEEGNDDSGTGPAPSTPDPGNTTQDPDNSGTSPAPSEPEPVDEGTDQTDLSNTEDEAAPPSNSGSGGSDGGNGNQDHDGQDLEHNNCDDDDNSSGGNSDTETGNTALSGTSPSSSSTGGNTGADQSPTSDSNNAGSVNEAPAAVVSPREKAKKALSNLSQWELDNLKATNKNDILAVYNDDKVTKKKLSFDANYKEVENDLPMQKDKNGNVIYSNTCKYNSTIGAFRLSGYTYKDGRTKEDVEKIASDAVSGEKYKPYTDVIKEVFGLDAIYHEIPAGLSEKELKALVGDNPAMVRFPQRDFWGNDKLPEDGEHGIGYSNGGFIEPYMGRYGESWKDVRGSNSQADFTSNLGGFYFEIKK